MCVGIRILLVGQRQGQLFHFETLHRLAWAEHPADGHIAFLCNERPLQLQRVENNLKVVPIGTSQGAGHSLTWEMKLNMLPPPHKLVSKPTGRQ